MRKMVIILAPAGSQLEYTLPITESNEVKGNLNLIMKVDQVINHTLKCKKGPDDHTNSRCNHKDEHYTHNRKSVSRINRSGDDD